MPILILFPAHMQNVCVLDLKVEMRLYYTGLVTVLFSAKEASKSAA